MARRARTWARTTGPRVLRLFLNQRRETDESLWEPLGRSWAMYVVRLLRMGAYLVIIIGTTPYIKLCYTKLDVIIKFMHVVINAKTVLK
jgi:hypothetical protein